MYSLLCVHVFCTYMARLELSLKVYVSYILVVVFRCFALSFIVIAVVCCFISLCYLDFVPFFSTGK